MTPNNSHQCIQPDCPNHRWRSYTRCEAHQRQHAGRCGRWAEVAGSARKPGTGREEHPRLDVESKGSGNVTEITGGSLFSGGIDGMGIAASLAGIDIRFHVEYDDWRRKVLEKHAWLWPNAIQHKDVTQVGNKELPQVDVLFGGFPCQDVSVSGDRRGLEEGTRSGLWFQFRRLIGDLRPRAVVIENTPGLLSLGGTTVVEDLRRLGYVGRVGVISAADAGAPHLRERVFIVAYSQQIRRDGRGQRDHGDQESDGRSPSKWAAHPVQAQRRRKGQLFNDAAHARSVKSGLGRYVDGFTPRLDGFSGFPAYRNQQAYTDEPERLTQGRIVRDRGRRIEALGDSIVWLAVYPIFYYLKQVLEAST